MAIDIRKIQRDEVLAKLDAAEQMVRDLCNGRKKWIMSIPARLDEDPDIVISDALAAARELIKEGRV